MTTTGVTHNPGQKALYFETTDANGASALIPAAVMTDVNGNPAAGGGGGSIGTPSVPDFIADAYTAPAAVAWTSATALNTANTVPTAGYDGVMISIVTAAGITGGVLTFEAYDGAAWIPVQAGKMNAYGGNTTWTLGASQSQGFQINVAGATQFRTRLSGAITGTGNVTITHLASSAPMPDPITVGLDPVQPLPAGSNTIGSIANASFGISGTLPGFAATPTVNVGTRGWSLTSGTDTVAIGGSLPAGSNLLGGTNLYVGGSAIALGVALSASSLPAVLASDQAAIPVTDNIPAILAQPAANAMAALNATAAWQVQGGGNYLLSLTNGPGATTAWVGTVTFQYSVNGGSTWNSLNATPLSSPTAANVTTSTANGLWSVNVPNGANVQVRTNMTAWTSGTAYADLVNASGNAGAIFLPWTYTVTSGQNVVAPVNVSGLSEVDVQISAVTTTVLTAQGTNDPTLTTWDTLQAFVANGAALQGSTLSAAATYRIGLGGYKYFRLAVTTTGTVLTVQGITGRIGAPITTQPVLNLGWIGGGGVSAPLANGSGYASMATAMSTAVSNTDQNATAFAGAGSVVGTTVASAKGGGAVISSEINVSALTLGTATAVFAILQESTGGTNWTDIWMSDPITATGITRMPAIPVQGRRRWRFFSAGGTSTTVTATITTLELPAGSYPQMRQMRDYYAATNPLASMVNSVAQAASTLVLTTASSTTTVWNVENTKALTAFMTLTGGTPTTQPVLTLQLSMDGTNWWNSAATLTATGAGTFVGSLANVPAKYARLIVTTASAGGTAYTLGNVGLYGVN